MIDPTTADIIAQDPIGKSMRMSEVDLEHNGSHAYQPSQRAVHLNLRLQVQEYKGKLKWFVENLPNWLLHPHYGPKVKTRAIKAHGIAVEKCQMSFPARFIAASEHFAYKNSPKESAFIVNLGTVQRMNIHHIQKEILDVVRKLEDLRARPVEENELTPLMAIVKSLMADYAKAVRDYDYMIAKAKDEWNPYKITTERWLDRALLNDFKFPVQDKAICSENLPMDDGILHYENIDLLPLSYRGMEVRNRRWRATRRRLIAAFLTGSALIGPMLLMELHKTLWTALGTVIVATFLLAIISANFTEWEDKDIMTAVAAYAAVLVVFVGSTGS